MLGEYSAVLDEHRTMLLAVAADRDAEFDIVAPVAFVPPDHMPSMPDELGGWARTLVAQTDGLAQLATELSTRNPSRRSSRHVIAVAVERPAALDALL